MAIEGEGSCRLSRRRALLSVPGLLAVSQATAFTTEKSARASLESYARKLMDASGTPGVSLVYGTGPSPSLTLNLGQMNADTGERVRASTLFPVASISKMVFAYGVLKYALQGKFDIDRPLASYALPAYLPKFAGRTKVTARDVLSHRSGLPNWIDGGVERPEEMAAARGRFRYSGEGYFWLQLAIEAVSGLSLNGFMTTVLFKPEGMANSTYVWGSGLAHRVAFGHVSERVASDQGLRDVLALIEPIAEKWGVLIGDWTHEQWLRAARLINPQGEHRKITFSNAAASLVMTMDDLYHFMTLLRSNWVEQGPVSGTVADQMRDPAVRVASRLDFWWGLGCAIERRADGSLVVGHEGNNLSYRAYAGIEPSTGAVLAIATNGDGGLGVYERLVRRIFGFDQLSFLAKLNPNYAN
ncbi:MAG: serine hydrolase domain-containing protein [Pseudomonadota bacterium]